MSHNKIKKVLFFDDEPFLIRGLHERLKRLGCDVILVSEIDDLFRELNESQYDIILMDMMAPIPDLDNKNVHFSKKDIAEMDDGINTGVVLAKKVWNIENYKDIPILFLSARQRPDSIIKSFQKEGKRCDCLRKPELPVTIYTKLNILLNHQE